jgi:hypothetical protein
VISLKPFTVAAFSILAESGINQGVQRVDDKSAGICKQLKWLKSLPGAGFSTYQKGSKKILSILKTL